MTKGRASPINLIEIETGKYTLKVSDNGIGFPADLDYRNTKTLGLKLVITLCRQLGGSIDVISENGTTFVISFEEIKYKERQ